MTDNATALDAVRARRKRRARATIALVGFAVIGSIAYVVGRYGVHSGLWSVLGGGCVIVSLVRWWRSLDHGADEGSADFLEQLSSRRPKAVHIGLGIAVVALMAVAVAVRGAGSALPLLVMGGLFLLLLVLSWHRSKETTDTLE
jgi:hypothetical protein